MLQEKKKKKFVVGKVENIAGKGENVGSIKEILYETIKI